MLEAENFTAKRSILPGITFVALLVCGAIAIVVGLIFQKYIWILGDVIVIASLYFTYDYFKTPKTLLSIEKESGTMTVKGKIFKLQQVKNVTCNPYTRTGGKRDWGTVTLTTASETIKLKYVSDCEAVTKNIKEIINDN